MEVQQTPLYRDYILSLGWSVGMIDDVAIFYRHLPFMGVMAKIQRPNMLPYLPKLIPFLRQLRVKTVLVEPIATEDPIQFAAYVQSLSKFFKMISSPFLPTKTIRVDVTPSEKIMFSSLNQAKRRAVRRAEKFGISITPSNNIYDLIAIKSKAAGTFGRMTTYGIDKLWSIFYKKSNPIYSLHKLRNMKL